MVGKRNVQTSETEMNTSLDELWCEDCDKSLHGSCKKHGTLHKIEDAVIPSRARLTLPPSLTLKTVKEDGKICVGVYAKRLIPVRSQFGPFDAPVISKTPIRETKPKEEKTVWKKKHAMQKSLEQSALAQTSDSVEQGSMTDIQTSPVIAPVQPVTAIQRQQLGSMMTGPTVSGTALASALQSNDALNQNLLSLSSQLIAHPELADSLQTLQQGLQMTSPGQGQGHLQIPMHSTPLLSNNQTSHLQLQGGLQDFPALNFQSPNQGSMQVTGMHDNLQSLQEQYQNYNHMDLAAPHPSAGLNGFVPPSSIHSLSVSLPTMQPNQSGSSSNLGAPPTDNESQSAEDSGVGDTSHANMSDSTILDYTSDTDVEESLEQDLSFEMKVHTEDGYLETYDKTDEEHSNWMIFVRPAKCVAEQTLVAYQEDGQIFFVSVKAIAPNTELKVWYSKDYAKSIGKSMLPSEEQTEQEEGKDDPLRCSACGETFCNATDFDNHPCLSKVKGRRKGRPRKYVKPTKTWRAKLEKARLKESIVKQEIGSPMHPRRRGRPRIKPIVIKAEKSTGTLIAEQVKSEKVKPQPPKSEERIVIQDMRDNVFDEDAMDGDEPEYVIALDNDNVTVTPLGPEAEIKKKRVAALVKKKRGPKTKKDPYICPHCNIKIVAEVQYHMHVYGHTGIKPFVCDYKDCGRGFMSKFKLERHSLIHSSPRDHKCLYCDKSFNRKDHLKNHMITHDPNKKVWKCERCAKEYSYSFSYRTHMAFHAAESGETLDCQICKKSFEKKEELLFHLKVHTGARAAKNATEKIHGCPECDKKFFTRKDVKRHLITHTKKRDFLCQFCPQRFGRKDHLSRHLRTSHTGDGQNKVRKAHGEGTTPKKRERLLYEKIEPTMVPLVNLSSMSEEDQQLLAGTAVVSGSQAVLQHLQYAISQMPGAQSGVREIQIPAGMFEAVAVSNPQPVTATSVSTIQPPPGMPSTQTSLQQHYTINEKGYIMNTNQADVNLLRQVHPGIDYRTLTQAVQQGNMYIASTLPPIQQQQEQLQDQQPALIATPTKIDAQTATELNRANGILQAAEYQLSPTKSIAMSDSPGKASVLMANSDQRQNPQAYQSLVGYIETLKFLENLPTNAGAAGAIQLQQLQNIANAQNVVNVQNLPAIDAPQQAHLIPVTYAQTSSVNQNIINISPADLKNYIAVPQSPTQSDLKSLVALSQNISQAELKNTVSVFQNPSAAELKNIIALSQPSNQADIKSLIAFSQTANPAELKNIIALSQAQNSLDLQQEMKGMLVTHSPGQQITYQQTQSLEKGTI